MKKILVILGIALFFTSCKKEEYTVRCFSKNINHTWYQNFDTHKGARGYKLQVENEPLYLTDTSDLLGYPVEVDNDCECEIN